MQWRECPEFPDYEVSESGWIRRVRSSQGAQITGKYLKPFMSFGYEKYSLYRDSKQFNVYGHRMVAMAFLGAPPFEGAMACHRDGSRDYNHYSNLRWDTSKGNADDQVTHGTRVRGEKASHSRTGTRLTAEQVIQIRALIAAGESQVSIGPRFNVAGQTVSKIARRETWAHIV